MDKCPNCMSDEEDANDFRTHFECGSMILDARPDTFRMSRKCEIMAILQSWADCISNNKSIVDTVRLNEHTTLVEDIILLKDQIKNISGRL